MSATPPKKLHIVLACIAGLVLSVVGWTFSVKHSLHTQLDAIHGSWHHLEDHFPDRYSVIFLIESLPLTLSDSAKTTLVRLKTNYDTLRYSQKTLENIGLFNQLEQDLHVLLSVLPQAAATQKIRNRLSGTQIQINFERRQFNEHVRFFNRNIQKFPNRYVTQLSGFITLPYLELFLLDEKGHES